MTGWLIADVGGTHSRLALAGSEIGRVRIYDNIDYAGLNEVIEDWLGELNPEDLPDRAALAVACPVRGDRVRMTNLGWTFSIDEFRSRFGFEDLRVVNDFVAIALAVPELGNKDVRIVKQGTADPDRPVAVIGPGTGLGVSALVPGKDTRIPVASEGGHVTLAPVTEEENRIITEVRDEFGHVSAERLLSGPGLGLLYRVLAGAGEATLPPETITHRARSGEDPIAVRAVNHFLAMLGTVTGNLALTLGAGSVYLAGGILPHLTDELTQSDFSECFMDKGRYREYLKTIPVFLITHPYPALVGLMSQK